MNADAIVKLSKKVTKKWAKQRTREVKNKRARTQRTERMIYYIPKVTLKQAAAKIMPDAYDQASNGGKHWALRRQIFYKARPLIQKILGETVKQNYFLKSLLPDYLSEHPDKAREWKIAADPRGHLTEPHTGKVIPVGTLEIAAYLQRIKHHKVSIPKLEKFALDYPTCGPKNRSSAYLFIEKEGFGPLFDQVQLDKRYDLTILSTKGQSVVSARQVVDELCAVSDMAGGVPLLILHDFDKAGFLIAECLTRVSQAARDAGKVRYEFQNEINWIDLGLRLDDVERWELESEEVSFRGEFASDTIATPEEQAFLRSNKRVELNAFSSGDLIKFIESKLDEHGIGKLVPDDETLAKAYRRAFQIEHVNNQLPALFEGAKGMADALRLPGDGMLANRVRRVLEENPAMPWDQAVVSILRQRRLRDEELS
jgi:hypothetical protein